jgi:hypothetical protein
MNLDVPYGITKRLPKTTVAEATVRIIGVEIAPYTILGDLGAVASEAEGRVRRALERA